MNAVVERIASGLAEVIFPRGCVHCRGLVEAAGLDPNELRHVCSRCARELEFVQAPHCLTCGHPFYGVVEGERICPHCAGLTPEFREGRTAVLLKGPARSLVIALKYHHALHVLEDIARIFLRTPQLTENVRGAVLVPVPLHPRKERERGYNQAQLIGQALAEVAGGGTKVAPVLRRVVDSTSQTQFDRRTRMANLKNAFALAPGAALTPSQHYILVDDVFTTGSTLNSCAHALRRSGIPNLDVVTFAHG